MFPINMINYFHIILVCILQIDVVYGAEKLVVEEMTKKTFTAADVDWSLEIINTCQTTDYTEFSSSSVLGFYGIGNTLSKTVSGLPAHWSISVRFDLVLAQSFDPTDRVDIKVDSTTSTYQKTDSNAGVYFCQPRNNWPDQLILFSKNVTHSNAQLMIVITNTLDEAVNNESYYLKNLYIFVDTCHPTCATCNGPADNQCLTCPPNSTKTGNSCTCNTGFVTSNNSCIASCLAGFVPDSTGKVCVLDFCDSTICSTCANKICTLCKSTYYLLQGQCLKSCPNYSTLNGSACDDFSLKNINGKYIYKGLYSDTFGESEVIGSGLSPVGFKGLFDTMASGALVTKCNSKSILGGAYLSSSGAYITKSFSALAPHWSVVIGYTFFKIDSWDSEVFYLQVDNAVKQSITKQLGDGQAICGRVQYNDDVVPTSQNFTHTATTLNLKFYTNLDGNAYQESFGIRELFILVDFCSSNCQICDASGCTKCQTGYFLYNHSCVSACPTTHAPDVNNTCQLCHPTCLTCSSPQNNLACLTCLPTTYLNPDKSCKSTCPNQYWGRDADLVCKSCDSSCYNCKNPGDANSCTSCSNSNYLYNNQCGTTCLPGTFKLTQTNNNICQKCHTDCETCDGPNNNNCLTCKAPNLFLQQALKTCVAVCNQNQYKNTTTQMCSSCNTSCATCFGPNDNNCLSCSGNNFLDETLHKCVVDCPVKYYKDTTNNKCSPCHSTCYTCSGSLPSNCLSCQLDKYFEPGSKQCVDQCNSDQYKDKDSIQCKTCDPSCLTCNGPNSNNCLTCQQGLYLLNNQCLDKCSDSYFVLPKTNICQQCNSTCKTCSGPKISDCLSCSSNLILLKSECYENCPSNYFTVAYPIKSCQDCHYKCREGCNGPSSDDCKTIKYKYQIILYILIVKSAIWILSTFYGYYLDKKQQKIFVQPVSLSSPIESDRIKEMESPQQIEKTIKSNSNIQKSVNQLKLDSNSQAELDYYKNSEQNQTIQFQIQLDLENMRRVGNRRPRQKFYKGPFYDKSLQTLEFQLPQLNQGRMSKKQNEQATTLATLPNLSELRSNVYKNSEKNKPKPIFINKYKMDEILKYSIIGNEWVSLFYFFDSVTTRITRTSLIFLKYQTFFLSSELIHAQSYVYLPLSLLMGWVVKSVFGRLQQFIVKKTQKMVAVIICVFIVILTVHIYFWFVPELNTLYILKDQRWSLYYAILFFADFIIFQQLFAFSQYLFTIKYLNNQYNQLNQSNLYSFVINHYFLRKLKS